MNTVFNFSHPLNSAAKRNLEDAIGAFEERLIKFQLNLEAENVVDEAYNLFERVLNGEPLEQMRAVQQLYFVFPALNIGAVALTLYLLERLGEIPPIITVHPAPNSPTTSFDIVKVNRV